MKDEIQKHIDHIDLAGDRYIEKKYLFVKFITSLAITLIGLLVALTEFDPLTHVAKILFLTSISLLLLCVLFSLLFLSSESEFHKKSAETRLKSLEEYSSHPENSVWQFEYVEIGKFYEVCEKLSFVFLFLWGFSLVSYVYCLLF